MAFWLDSRCRQSLNRVIKLNLSPLVERLCSSKEGKQLLMCNLESSTIHGSLRTLLESWMSFHKSQGPSKLTLACTCNYPWMKHSTFHQQKYSWAQSSPAQSLCSQPSLRLSRGYELSGSGSCSRSSLIALETRQRASFLFPKPSRHQDRFRACLSALTDAS